jgi:hypothetical protein
MKVLIHPHLNYRTMTNGGCTTTTGTGTMTAGGPTTTSEYLCLPLSETRHPEVVRRVITQINNRIIFIFNLGHVSKFRTLAAVIDHF